MPVYEYQCSDGHEFEAVRRVPDRFTAICTQCGKTGSQLISLPAQPVIRCGEWRATDSNYDPGQFTPTTIPQPKVYDYEIDHAKLDKLAQLDNVAERI